MEEKSTNKREYDHLQSYCIKFESNDSEVSDGSYQSSLSSNQDNDYDNIEYFREEMARFFINYPQLMNNELLDNKLSYNEEEDKWGGLANNIFQESKESEVSLQNIAKRIAYYRKKAEEVDIIDLIAKEKDSILKELEEEASTNINQKIPTNKVQMEKRSASLGLDTQNNYLSWKKKNERYVLDRSNRNSQRKRTNQNLGVTSKDKQQKFRATIMHDNKKLYEHHTPENKKMSYRGSGVKQTQRIFPKEETKQNFVDPGTHPNKASNQSVSKHAIFKIEPKTEVGKQLLEEIKKHHFQQDQIGIKKCIVNFISKYRENLQKQMKEKSALPQRLSKLHIEDSKQLLLFCPIKKHGIQTDMPLKNQTEQFLDILKQISEGHLMQYWRLLQQKKL